MSDVVQEIEAILDKDADDRRGYDVILQVSTGFEKETEEITQRVVDALRYRRMIVDPREILPDLKGLISKSKSNKRLLNAQKFSLTAQSALASKSSGKKIKTRADKALKKLSQHSALARYYEQRKKQSKSKKVTTEHFWSSGSCRVVLKRDELAALRDIEGQLNTVHVNRRLQVPPISKANLPLNAGDQVAGTWGLQASGALAVWGAYQTQGSGVRVAVLDTGVDATHPDLIGKVAEFAEFDSSGAQIGNQPRDSHVHGTHVCGTVAGGNNSGPWIGVAPDAELIVGLVLDGNNGGSDAQVLAGMDWAINRKAQVINMSLGGLSLNPIVQNTYHQAIVNALLLGIPVVTAIGNDGHQTTGLPGADLFAFSVGATDSRDDVAGFSGGRTQVLQSSPFIDPAALPLPYSKPEISAPGVEVLSCVPKGKYDAFNGTSMATPHVAGCIALLLSATNGLNQIPPEQRAFLIQDLLNGSVERRGESGQDHRYGFGRVDILNAISQAREQGL